MRIITWNVNSVRAREARLLALLERHQPDVLCLQELKVEDAAFPVEAVEAKGYHALTFGQKTYNGVALLSRDRGIDVVRGLRDDEPDEQSRLIGATFRGVRVYSAYFPNGGEVGSDKYQYKLRWMARLRSMLDRTESASDPLVLAGDFNVAPEDRDAKDPADWRDGVLANDEVRGALLRIREFGLRDSLRCVTEEGGLFSWWDYRMLGFQKNRGLRIDHLDVTAPLVPRIVTVRIDRDERKGAQPSDHAPVILDVSSAP